MEIYAVETVNILQRGERVAKVRWDKYKRKSGRFKPTILINYIKYKWSKTSD